MAFFLSFLKQNSILLNTKVCLCYKKCYICEILKKHKLMFLLTIFWLANDVTQF